MDYNFNNDNRDDFTLKREAMVDKFREKNDLETRANESLKANKAFMKLFLYLAVWCSSYWEWFR